MSADPQREREAALYRAASMRDALRRSAELLVREPDQRACTSTREDFAALRTHAHAIDLIADACARYRQRPCLGERARETRGGSLAPRFSTITFGELWDRCAALATALTARGFVRPGDLVAIHGFSSIDWVVADLACLYLGATSVPVQTSLRPEELEHVFEEARPSCILSSVDHLDALAPIARRDELRAIIVMDEDHATGADVQRRIDDTRAIRAGLVVEPLSVFAVAQPVMPPVQWGAADPLVTLSYTSGSTGSPKGVLYPDHRWLQRMREALAEAPLPYVTVSYLALSQMGGRLTTLRSLVSGGLTCFSPATDLSTFFDDVRLVRPTQLMLIPRVSNLIYQIYQRRILSEDEPAVLADLRANCLGDRLCLVTTGAAPTAPEVLAFLARCFACSVINAYGATELGMVTVNGHVRPDVEYKLVDVPELGYTTSDVPYPRGELLVRTPYKAPGYFKGAAPKQVIEDTDGFIRSGDIVEQRGPRHVVWIDRRSDVVRLQQGEFVSVSRLEQIFAVGGPYIAQIYVHANPLRAYVQAVIVPHGDATEPLLLDELHRIARAHELKPHEIPRSIIVEGIPFSRENGLLTESDKPRRAALKAAYSARLDELADAFETRQLRELDVAEVAKLSIPDRIVAAAAVALGRDDHAVDTAASFIDLGGDSLSALRFVELVASVCGAAPPVAAVLDRHTTLAQLTARLGGETPRLTMHTLHGESPTHLRASQLAVARVIGDELAAASTLPGPVATPRVVLVTGASGFLGRFVLLELLERLAPIGGRVICIARARDDADASKRVAAQYAGEPALAARFASCRQAYSCLAGDLLRPRFGLDEPAYEQLAEDVDAIVHCGALVNHMLPYSDLFEPNVVGTVEVMRFAIRRRVKPIRFASSVGVAAGLRLDVPVAEDRTAAQLRSHFPIATAYGVGYSASKWAGEVMLTELAAHAAVPVQIFRCCGMILSAPPLRARQINETALDLFSRLLFGLASTGIAPPSFYDSGQRAHFDGLPVDLVAAAIAAAPFESGLAIYHASNDRWDDGASLDRVVDWIADAGIPVARMDDYAAWFAQFRARLAELDETSRRRSPLGSIERWEHPTRTSDAPHFSTTRFRALVRDRLGEHDLPTLDAAFVRRCLGALGISR